MRRARRRAAPFKRGGYGGTRLSSAWSALLLGFGALLVIGCCHGRVPQNGPPPLAPTTVVIAIGDGNLAGGHLGPSGGRIELGPAAGPGFEIPAGTAGAGGLSISVAHAESTGVPQAAGVVGPAFRSSVGLSPPSGSWVGVHSAPVAEPPSGCAGTKLELALEEPPSAGPGDSAGSPALVWTYRDAVWRDKVAVAELPKLEPVRMIFLCGVVH